MIDGDSMIHLRSIGTVHNATSAAHRDTRWQDSESEIEIDAPWRDALDGLDAFSHIWVLTYLDRLPAPESLRVNPKPADASVRVGIFATRSPQRPNPIGICAVELLQVRGNVLRVRGLDALDGTPVLDIKPYLARRDAIEHTRVAAWARDFGAFK